MSMTRSSRARSNCWGIVVELLCAKRSSPMYLVEQRGLEPRTPCLQSRCSSQLSYCPEIPSQITLFNLFSQLCVSHFWDVYLDMSMFDLLIKDGFIVPVVLLFTVLLLILRITFGRGYSKKSLIVLIPVLIFIVMIFLWVLTWSSWRS